MFPNRRRGRKGNFFKAALWPRGLAFFAAIALSGCGLSSSSYPEARLQQSLKEICKTEYGIDRVESKIVGKTLGVYLPLEKLFSSDFEEILAGGKVKDLSSLLQIAPETLDKVEDVLFSTSRVILSTDKPIDFYELKATDTELTGISLILVGYVQDIKRVRFWDISRSEYRKRVFHDMKVNYPVIWKRPVEVVFKNLGRKTTREILDRYFLPGANLENISPLFYSLILDAQLKKNLTNEILSLRSTGGRAGEALVYVKVRENYEPKKAYADHKFTLPSGFESEYIFVLTKYLGDYKISRVIPFYYVDDSGAVQKVDFPPELKLYENVDKWREEFELEEVFLPDFLAQQITRRVQSLLSEDERLQNTFSSRRVIFSFDYDDDDKKDHGHFSVRTNLSLKKTTAAVYDTSGFSGMGTSEGGGIADLKAMLQPEALEDVYYLLDVVMRECAAVLHGYSFENYDAVEFESVFGVSFTLKKEDLQLYRRKKLTMAALLDKSAPAIKSN